MNFEKEAKSDKIIKKIFLGFFFWGGGGGGGGGVGGGVGGGLGTE